MCQYRIITFSCGHTIHSRVRNSQQCGDVPCSSTSAPIAQITTYYWCSPCNRGEGAVQGHKRTNLRRRRNAQIDPSDIAAAIARQNARVRRARNISVPELTSTVIPPPFASYAHRYSSANAEAARRVAYGIPGNIEVDKQAVDHTIRSTRSLSGGWRRGIVVFLFYVLLFCFLLVYTFLFFAYFREWFSLEGGG